jgi:hypothetical protein
MASASHCSKFCTKCSSVRVQAKLLIYLFFILFSIYLFFNKKYIQGSQIYFFYFYFPRSLFFKERPSAQVHHILKNKGTSKRFLP